MKKTELTNPLAAVLAGSKMSPSPIWLMRQAGRYLPEYQETRKRAGSFWTMCMTPALAAEVTLQPIRRFGFDAAIIFSDILVIPHALGQEVRFEDGIGPVLVPISGTDNLVKDGNQWAVSLTPVYEAIQETRAALPSAKSLIGFAGGPWTLAAYMTEGRGSKEQGEARLWAYRNPQEFETLLTVLSEAVSAHLIRQLEAGANVVQIFDSWAGGLPATKFLEWVVRPTKIIVAKVREHFPQAHIIGFPRQATQTGLELYVHETGVDGLSIDTATSIGWAAQAFGGSIAIQGNLDPVALVAGGDVLDRAIDEILEATAATPAIFNLGHGILPTTPIAHVERLIEKVRAG